MDRVGSLELSAPMSDLRLVDTWRVAHPGVQAWSHVSAVTATRIDLILASCAAAAADMSVAPLETDHRMVSATILTASRKRSLLLSYAPVCFGRRRGMRGCTHHARVQLPLFDSAAWLNMLKLKRAVAIILEKAAI